MARKQSKNVPEDATTTTPEAATKRRQVYLDEDLFRKGGIIAAALGISLPDFINNRLRPIIDEELPRVLDAMGLGPLKK